MRDTSVSRQTTNSKRPPLTRFCAVGPAPTMFGPLPITPTMRTPRITPRIVPLPPARLTPPIATAARVSSSSPLARASVATASPRLTPPPPGGFAHGQAAPLHAPAGPSKSVWSSPLPHRRPDRLESNRGNKWNPLSLQCNVILLQLRLIGSSAISICFITQSKPSFVMR